MSESEIRTQTYCQKIKIRERWECGGIKDRIILVFQHKSHSSTQLLFKYSRHSQFNTPSTTINAQQMIFYFALFLASLGGAYVYYYYVLNPEKQRQAVSLQQISGFSSINFNLNHNRRLLMAMAIARNAAANERTKMWAQRTRARAQHPMHQQQHPRRRQLHHLRRLSPTSRRPKAMSVPSPKRPIATPRQQPPRRRPRREATRTGRAIEANDIIDTTIEVIAAKAGRILKRVVPRTRKKVSASYNYII